MSARVSTAGSYDSALATLQRRQAEMSNAQMQMTSGKRVNRPSDDPTAAARAERALIAQQRIESAQRSVGVSRNAMALTESALGRSGDAPPQSGAPRRPVRSGAPRIAMTTDDRTTRKRKQTRDHIATTESAAASASAPASGEPDGQAKGYGRRPRPTQGDPGKTPPARIGLREAAHAACVIACTV